MLKQLSSRERKLALAVLAFALAMGVYHLAWRPGTKMLENLDQQIQLAEAKLLKTARITHNAARINMDYEKLAPAHQFKETDEEMLSSLLRSVESLARGASVTITDIKPRPGEQSSNHKTYFIELDVESAMPALFGFLHALESSPELFRVQKLSISPRGSDPKALRAHLVLSRIVWI